MNHSTTPKIGIRGVIADRNYKLLLLVNGRNITDKANAGLIAEFDHWDANDIAKIEVISGAGGVTYGPGAISGVISITTKTSADSDGTRVGAIANPRYEGGGLFVEHAVRNEEKGFGLYAYVSLVSTEGSDDAAFYQPDPSKTTPYQGHDDSYTAPALKDRGDTYGDDQIKAHLDIDIGDNMRAWARYTRAGYSPPRGTQGLFAGELDPVTGYGIESFTGSLTHDLHLSEGALIKTRLAYDSHSYMKVRSFDRDLSVDNPINRSWGYSENEWFLQSIYSSNAFDNKLSYAVGAEYSYETLRAPWGEGQENLFVKDSLSLRSGDRFYLSV